MGTLRKIFSRDIAKTAVRIGVDAIARCVSAGGRIPRSHWRWRARKERPCLGELPRLLQRLCEPPGGEGAVGRQLYRLAEQRQLRAWL